MFRRFYQEWEQLIIFNTGKNTSKYFALKEHCYCMLDMHQLLDSKIENIGLMFLSWERWIENLEKFKMTVAMVLV